MTIDYLFQKMITRSIKEDQRVEANLATLLRRMMSECQAIVAEAITQFGKVDIVVCCSSQGMQSLISDQRCIYLMDIPAS